MDRFLEEVVKKHKRGLDEVLYYLSLVMMVVFGIMGMMFLSMLAYSLDVVTIVSTVLLLGMAVYLFFFHDKLRTEYEYTFTNGSMDFAMVFNNKKRKSLGSLNVAKVDAFGKVSSGSFHRHISTPNVKQLRWFLNRDSELYYFAFSKDGKKSVMVFEPSEQMVDYIKHYLPYGVYQEN
ncbi:MAG: hypothetical protein IJZ74_06460 [Clostridia bacterium]|nr:hypothetical protein [Clostridia bacterium]